MTIMQMPLRSAARRAPFPIGARAWPDFVKTGECAVYRFFDVTGVLLYVGISWNPASRWERHRRIAPWWHRAVSVLVDVYAHEGVALDIERHWISHSRPVYNVRSARR